MCRICEPILGPNCRVHTEEKCPLKKASFCSICGPNTHFNGDCPLKLAARPFSHKPIPSSKVIKKEKIYIMPNKNSSYMEYLRFHEIVFDTVFHENRLAVEKHLASRGYILKNPPEISDDICVCKKCV